MSFKELRALLDQAGHKDGRAEEVARPKVLIIDDDQDVRESLQFALRDEFDVILTASAEAGVSAMTENLAVVVIDIQMHGKNGFWAAEQIQQRLPCTPVIFYSGYQDAKNPYDVINDHHPFAFVIKGDGSDKLLETIRRAARHSERVRDNQVLMKRLSTIEAKMKSLNRTGS